MCVLSYNRGRKVSEYLISDKLIVDDVEVVVQNIKRLSNLEEYDISKINKDLTTLKVFYVDNYMKKTNEKGAKYALVATGEVNHKGEELVISLVRHGSEFCGHVVNTLSKLAYWKVEQNPAIKNRVMTNYKRINISGDKVKPNEKYTAVSTHNSHDEGLIKKINEIIVANPFETEHGLEKYVRCIAAKAYNYVKDNNTSYYIMNSLKSIVINTGLIDKFGEYIKVMYKFHVKDELYIMSEMMSGVQSYIDNRFTVKDANTDIKPISLNDNSIIFNPSIDEFDLSLESMQHCICDRVGRFPEGFRELPPSQLAARIRSELEIGLKICKADYRYAKQIYNAKTDENTVALPLHVETGFLDAPELIMCIKRMDGFWSIRTILCYDGELRDQLRRCQLYTELW